MAIVAGVDFGTLNVRVSIVDSQRGLLATALAEYPLHRKREDPEYATQSHDEFRSDLLGGIVMLKHRGAVYDESRSGGALYSQYTPIAPRLVQSIPYYA